MSSKNPLTYVAAGVAAVVLAFGAYAIGSSNSSDSGTADASQAAARNGAGPPTGRGPAGFGSPVAGAAAAKVKAAALAKYPGTVERVFKLSDGSYVVHVLRSSGEVHVKVSKDFVVTGTENGMPGRAAAGPPPGATQQ